MNYKLIIIYIIAVFYISILTYSSMIVIKDVDTNLTIIDSLKTEIQKQKQKKFDTITVTVTVYHAVAEQCNADYLHTASMFKLDKNNQYKHKIVAVSRDLLNVYPYGSQIVVNGTGIYDGVWNVEDTMNKRYTNHIDLLINTDMKIGKWNNIKITKI